MWTTFFSSVASASATLAGLIFVGVSISLARILSVPRLPDRALQSLTLLLVVLVTSLMQLVPGQPVRVVGVEFLGTGLVAWLMATGLDWRMLRHSEASYRGKFVMNAAFSQLAVLPYLAAGIAVFVCGPAGIYWIVPGILFSFVKAMLDAWVLLVEIHR